MFLPGAGATIGVSYSYAVGTATSEHVAATALGFVAGAGIKHGITMGLDKLDGPAVADPCGCNGSNSGFGAALHSFVY
jgi:hypothetical protein